MNQSTICNHSNYKIVGPRKTATAAQRRPGPHRVHGASFVSPRTNAGHLNSFAAWLTLIGVILPTELSVSIGGAKFTPGRIGVAMLVLPALFILCTKGRHLIISDFIVFAISAWMIGAVYSVDPGALPSAIAESLEFGGAYFVARGFFMGPLAIGSFIRVLKILSVISIMGAIADHIFGRLIVHDIIASAVHATPPEAQYRNGVVRAASTFDHAILFGSFCSFVGAILLYSEPAPLKRLFWAGLCLLGCLLAWSSGPLMSIIVIFMAYFYDRLLNRHHWRWVALWSVMAASGLALTIVAKHPLDWIISHLTLDPVSGYFRYIIWDAAISYISQAPVTGFGFQLLNHPILDTTVDSVWLACTLRFGIPCSILLLFANISVLIPGRSLPIRDADMEKVCTGFTMTLIMLMFIGLTVHYWNYLWIFWGLCLGVRGSIREWFITAGRSTGQSGLADSGAFRGRYAYNTTRMRLTGMD